ncbi:MAG: PIN domain nuclease [Cyanobacteria bacterium J06648_11]
MILVDSSVWIDYFNGVTTPATDKLHNLLGRTPIAIGDLILLEVLQGFKRDKDFATAQSLFASVHVFNLLDADLAVKAAQHYRFLLSQGITVRKTADTIIATFCIENGLPLLHSDRDFRPFQDYLGLTVPT